MALEDESEQRPEALAANLDHKRKLGNLRGDISE